MANCRNHLCFNWINFVVEIWINITIQIQMEMKSFIELCHKSIGSKTNPFVDKKFTLNKLNNQESQNFVWCLFKDAYRLQVKVVDDANVIMRVGSSHDDIFQFALQFGFDTISMQTIFS